MKDPEFEISDWERSIYRAAGQTDEEIDQAIRDRVARQEELKRQAELEAEEEQELFYAHGGVIDGVRTPETVGTEEQRAAYRQREPRCTEREIDAYFYQDYRERILYQARHNLRFLAHVLLDPHPIEQRPEINDENAQDNYDDEDVHEDDLNILDGIVFNIDNDDEDDDAFINVVD